MKLRLKRNQKGKEYDVTVTEILEDVRNIRTENGILEIEFNDGISRMMPMDTVKEFKFL